MFDIYLTSQPQDSAHPERVTGVTVVEERDQAAEICTAIQPYLRDGVEAHFVTVGE